MIGGVPNHFILRKASSSSLFHCVNPDHVRKKKCVFVSEEGCVGHYHHHTSKQYGEYLVVGGISFFLCSLWLNEGIHLGRKESGGKYGEGGHWVYLSGGTCRLRWCSGNLWRVMRRRSVRCNWTCRVGGTEDPRHSGHHFDSRYCRLICRKKRVEREREREKERRDWIDWIWYMVLN